MCDSCHQKLWRLFISQAKNITYLAYKTRREKSGPMVTFSRVLVAVWFLVERERGIGRERAYSQTV